MFFLVAVLIILSFIIRFVGTKGLLSSSDLLEFGYESAVSFPSGGFSSRTFWILPALLVCKILVSGETESD